MNIIFLIQDSLEVAKETINKSVDPKQDINWWFWIAIAEFGIIAYFVLKSKLNRSRSLKQKLKKESLDREIDFDNIINSSFNSNEIYDELKVRCHPDRFPNDKDKNEAADKLFQEITKNKNNVKRLLELKKEAKQKLNINF
jgi:hypothetical protein